MNSSGLQNVLTNYETLDLIPRKKVKNMELKVIELGTVLFWSEHDKK